MKLVDTTFLIDLLHNDKNAVEKALELGDTDAYTTEMNVFEIVLGIYFRKKNVERAIAELEKVLLRLVVLPMNHHSAIEAGKIAGMLRANGTQIEDNDCIIAGIAKAHGITTIVTKNTKHFNLINGLTVEEY